MPTTRAPPAFLQATLLLASHGLCPCHLLRDVSHLPSLQSTGLSPHLLVFPASSFATCHLALTCSPRSLLEVGVLLFCPRWVLVPLSTLHASSPAGFPQLGAPRPATRCWPVSSGTTSSLDIPAGEPQAGNPVAQTPLRLLPPHLARLHGGEAPPDTWASTRFL